MYIRSEACNCFDHQVEHSAQNLSLIEALRCGLYFKLDNYFGCVKNIQRAVKSVCKEIETYVQYTVLQLECQLDVFLPQGSMWKLEYFYCKEYVFHEIQGRCAFPPLAMRAVFSVQLRVGMLPNCVSGECSNESSYSSDHGRNACSEIWCLIGSTAASWQSDAYKSLLIQLSILLEVPVTTDSESGTSMLSGERPWPEDQLQRSRQ